MKNRFLISSALLFSSLNAMAYNEYISGSGCGIYSWPAVNCNSVKGCSPEVTRNNVQTVEDTLAQLSNQELKQATRFKLIISKTQSLEESKKIQAYFNLMGLQTDAQIAEFVGAREIPLTVIENLSKNTGLNQAESQLVLSKVAEAILGERK